MDGAPDAELAWGQPEKTTPVEAAGRDTPSGGETRVEFSGVGVEAQAVGVEAQAVGAMSTDTFMVDFLASVKITPLTGGTSP